MAPWLEHVLEWVHTLSAKVAALLSPAAAALTKAISDNKDKVQGDVVDYFKTSAYNAVTQAKAEPGDNWDKAKFALSLFTSDLATNGITLAENEAKLLLENAYANLKASNA